MTSAFAPGKVILFGEHAVVYGQPAMAIPVQKVGITVTVTALNQADLPPSLIWQEKIILAAPSVNRSGTLASQVSDNNPDPIEFIVKSVLALISIMDPPPIHIQLDSTMPIASGLGSGASVSVALCRAISSYFNHSLSDEQVNQIAFEAEKIYHGTPSGIDNTVITFEKPVYFVKGSPVETFSIKKPFTLIIADTGIRAETLVSVGDVRQLWLAQPKHYETIFSEIGKIVNNARLCMQNGDIDGLGHLMNKNHQLLQKLTVSSHSLDQLVEKALDTGALGAKLSGGGRGGNIIALVQQEDANRVADALLSAGACNTIITQVR